MAQSRSAPTYLHEFAFNDKSGLASTADENEWRGKIKSSTNNTWFKIKFYGEICIVLKKVYSFDFSPVIGLQVFHCPAMGLQF
jgi:hypothetical protein